MTVTASTPRLEYAGNGVTVAFSTPKFYANSHIKAYLVEDADPTNVTTWALTTDFTLSNLGAATGTLTAVTAPATGYTLVVFREVPLEQTHDYTDADDFPAESHERALDLLTMQVQQLDERVDRAFRLSDSDTSGLSLELSGPTSLYTIRVNAAGTALEFVDAGSATLQVPADDSVTLAKMAEIAQYQIYTRTSSGTGNPELFNATAAGFALLDDASAADQRTTLGLGTIATQASSNVSITGGTISNGVTLGAASETYAGALEIATDAEAQAFTANKAIDGAKLSTALKGSNQSLAASGYQKLPGGLILQWGRGTVGAGSSLAVTLPLTFPNACLQAFACDYGALAGPNYASAAVINSTSQITLYNADVGSQDVAWLAIGH